MLRELDRPAYSLAAIEHILANRPANEAADAAIDPSQLATMHRERERRREAWNELIDASLLEWGKDPGILQDEEEGLIAPSREMISLAYWIATDLRDADFPPPIAIVPTVAGGIAFERRDKVRLEVLEIRPDRSVEVRGVENSKLV